ncbi:MAG TPA: alpha/beta fold hydrolase [Bryobacteraceae bacterium]|nr:alpha/beta fold hydrolase [Bryobacteraceae bacterium]
MRLSVALCLLFALRCTAQYPDPVSADFTIRDFHFASGESLPELRLHYRTIGELKKDRNGKATNAVLILHGTTGSGAGFLSSRFAGKLFGPGQPLDASKYFLILPDAIGHGASAKPSDGLRARFPRYTYADMVDAQHRLVTEGLGVSHLRLVMGTSMGGMHTWSWAVRWPDEMDALFPLASAPVELAGRNRALRWMISNAIRNDPTWNNGDYTEPPRSFDGALYALFFMVSSPGEQHREAPSRDEADRYMENWIANERRLLDANDMLYAFEASRDYDPSPYLEKIRAPLFAVNSADDEVNPPELGILEREMKRVAKGRYILIPTGPDTRGHGTHSLPAVWGKYLSDLLAATAQPVRRPGTIAKGPLPRTR